MSISGPSSNTALMSLATRFAAQASASAFVSGARRARAPRRTRRRIASSREEDSRLQKESGRGGELRRRMRRRRLLRCERVTLTRRRRRRLPRWRVAQRRGSFISWIAVMMCVAGRACDPSGETAYINPSVTPGRASAGGQARCAIAPSSLTAARSTSNGSWSFARSRGTCAIYLSIATWFVAHSRQLAASVSSTSRRRSGCLASGARVATVKPSVASRR